MAKKPGKGWSPQPCIKEGRHNLKVPKTRYRVLGFAHALTKSYK